VLSSLRHDPVPYDLNRRQAALQRLRYRLAPCGSVGQSYTVAAVLPVPTNCVVAQKPLPLSHIPFSKAYQPAPIFQQPARDHPASALREEKKIKATGRSPLHSDSEIHMKGRVPPRPFGIYCVQRFLGRHCLRSAFHRASLSFTHGCWGW
jgi:hypothetical protein